MSRHSFKYINLTRFLALAWLLSICPGVSLFFNFRPDKDPNLVFCPLQKNWVKRNPPTETPAPPEPLADICTSNKQKESFIYEGFQKLAFSRITLDAKQLEKLFFDYAEKGKVVFTTVSNSNSVPETQLAKSVNSEKAAFNFHKQFFKREDKQLLLAQHPRPGGLQPTANFISQKFNALKDISRKISPRAPPVFV